MESTLGLRALFAVSVGPNLEGIRSTDRIQIESEGNWDQDQLFVW